ncbi:hypothetical protein [Pseudomonas sp. T1.Ur]|uniref:hypothetical protein n=1 Tax=Pseudomonas sp. T1.Ur TaxID=2928704 RepID=UPI00201D44BE|nr:hypothetical protein [Pseudomonas sp. T1.Ur]MCL6701123.1 hypothetical protein [Pseudomonas sp. T1.Ur]
MSSKWKLVPVEPTQSILDAMTTERKKGNGVLQMWFEAMAAAPAPPESDAKSVCDHEWTDDGEFLLVCTKCGTQENHDPKWRDMESAPKDGTLLRLLVSFDEHSTEDADEAPTIGANNFDNDGEDAWRFAGWCWTHDHFTQGVGTPVGWLPMIDASASTELDRVTAERDALQLRLTVQDQRVDELEEEVGRLNRVKLSLKGLAESRADNCSVYREHLNEALSLAEKVRDSSLGMQRKSLNDLIVYLYRHSAAALKPTAEAESHDQ